MGTLGTLVLGLLRSEQIIFMEDLGAGGDHIMDIIGVDGIPALLERVGIPVILTRMEIGSQATGGFATDSRNSDVRFGDLFNYGVRALPASLERQVEPENQRFPTEICISLSQENMLQERRPHCQQINFPGLLYG